MSDRAAFLARLDAHGFLPPEAAVAAWNRTAEHPLPLSRDARRDLADEAGPEIAKFLAAFWSLDPAERRTRWEAWRAWHPDGRAAARLKALEPALAIPAAPDYADPYVKELSALFRELALLPRAARTARRHEWLARAGDRKEWANAIHTLRKTEPAVPTLDLVLADWIERFLSLPAAVEAVRTTVPARPAAGEADAAWRSHVAAAAARGRDPTRPIRPADGTTRKTQVSVLVGVVAVLTVIRVLIGVSTDSKPTAAPAPVAKPWQPAPVGGPAPVSPTISPELEARFTQTELLAFYEYDPATSRTMPPHYAEFLKLDGHKMIATLRTHPITLTALRVRADVERAKKRIAALSTPPTRPK